MATNAFWTEVRNIVKKKGHNSHTKLPKITYETFIFTELAQK